MWAEALYGTKFTKFDFQYNITTAQVAIHMLYPPHWFMIFKLQSLPDIPLSAISMY